MRYLLNTFCLILFLQNLSFSQTQEKQINALNNYVQFVNESTHGMLIIHRLLENYNQETNKYVDIARYKINNYSNKDLPKDIFLDKENWFYEISPTSYYDIAILESHVLNQEDVYQMNFIIKKIKDICSKANKLRFTVENSIKINSLKDTTYLRKIYNLLEDGSKLYTNYYHQQKALESLIAKQTPMSSNGKYDTYYDAFKTIYKPLREVMDNLRNKDEININNNIHQYKTQLDKFNNSISDTYFGNKRMNQKLKFVKDKTTSALRSMEILIAQPEVPIAYKTYGKYYYYHNANLANKTNKYGNGFIVETNNIIIKTRMNKVLFFEIPHFLKVIYPKKELTWRKRDYSKKTKARSKIRKAN